MYKIFGIDQLAILNSNRFSGTENSVVRSNDGKLFFTQFRTGIELTETEISEALNLAQLKVELAKPNWVKSVEL